MKVNPNWAIQCFTPSPVETRAIEHMPPDLRAIPPPQTFVNVSNKNFSDVVNDSHHSVKTMFLIMLLVLRMVMTLLVMIMMFLNQIKYLTMIIWLTTMLTVLTLRVMTLTNNYGDHQHPCNHCIITTLMITPSKTKNMPFLDTVLRLIRSNTCCIQILLQYIQFLWPHVEEVCVMAAICCLPTYTATRAWTNPMLYYIILQRGFQQLPHLGEVIWRTLAKKNMRVRGEEGRRGKGRTNRQRHRGEHSYSSGRQARMLTHCCPTRIITAQDTFAAWGT